MPSQLLLITQKGTIVRQGLSAISEQGRATTGVRLQKVDADDHVVSVSIVEGGEEGEEGEEGEVGEEEEEVEGGDLPVEL